MTHHPCPSLNYGVLYTAGAIVYAKKGFRYHHLVWHLFIDLALLSHLAGIVFFIG
ncbi:membrane protein, hemolysin III [human gut metagenome]|uniref:Membrane protein, hemolysin III n=1 Tax=human gut metagenome TaxID=408170 RepID=K1U906_9ZZZZ